MYTLLIAEPSEYLRDSLKAALSREYLVHSCGDGYTALELMNHLEPDAVIIDLYLPGMDGLTVLQKAHWVPPLVLGLSALMSHYVLYAAETAGVGYVLPVPCSVEAVVLRLRAMAAAASLPRTFPAYHAQTDTLLQTLGFANYLAGYRMLCLAIPLFARDVRQSLSKELYPALVVLLGHTCTPEAIEHDIRSAITTAWKHRDPSIWEELFPHSHRPPSNKQFLAVLANSLKI